MLIFEILLTCLVFNILACNNCLCWYSKSCWPALYLIFQPATIVYVDIQNLVDLPCI